MINMMNHYIRINLRHVACLILVTSLSSIFAALLPYITADFIDEIEALTSAKIIRYGILFIGSVAGLLLFEYCSKVVSTV